MTRILSVSYKPEMEGMGQNAHSLAGVKTPYVDDYTLYSIHTAMMFLLCGKQITSAVARRETKRLVYKLQVLGQPVTSEVRSSVENP